MSRDEIVTRLADTGLWPAFRTRPFSRVPAADSEPHAIFVTAIDTQPLSPDPRVVIRPNSEVFHAGLRILPRLTGGTVWLCTGPDWDETDVDIERLQRVEFSGPHPAGLAGTHIHYLDPASRSRTVWHIGYQDVIALGKLFRDGELATERVIALAGDAVSRPRLIRARVGASIAELTAGQLREPGRCRRISGSMLSGRAAVAGESFLGRYHQQVSVLADADVRQVFGWPGLAARRYTASRTWLAKTGHRRKYVFSTAQNGRFSAMLPLPLFEKVLPLDILPSMLFRALMVTDTDRAQALGCLELDEEDLALCSFVCPAKSDYGAILRRNLDQIERHT